MTDIWNGDILLPDGNVIRDVGLASQNVASSPALPATSLRFLTTVDTAKIPLYLAAGPSLDVWTTEEATQAWFEAVLLSKPTLADAPNTATKEWWDLARSQSPIGFLVQVQRVEEDGRKPRVTEILFYGTIAAPTTAGLPTPPSSSPYVDNAHAEILPELRVHALPLSYDLLHATSIDLPSDTEPQFLPPQHDFHNPPTSPKRTRDIFEEATIANKKARGRGGRAVSAAAARVSESQQAYTHRKSSLSIDLKASSFSDSRPTSASDHLARPSSRPLSRSPSITSDTRPLSRKGQPDAHARRSNLSQVATVPIQPEEPTTESRNKDALVKVVMAAMRMHGLQQRKQNRSRRASVAGAEESQQRSEEAAAEEAAKDDEYKLIYHQTFKGAQLALRKHMSEKPLHATPDRMRDIVEKLLALFLSDPLAEPPPTEIPADPVATPGSRPRFVIPGSTHGHASPFDLPSTQRRPGMMRSVTDSHVYTGSPVSKKRVTTGETLTVPT
ncbi:uncharacterized protein J4E78_009328 [Alternaria triticimaculans]|uniref:uncharacterized protein n=1 Tax=Alternaria triticimaculans TaxID=297637 RepID=UPI0020C4619F|nr:uncharacterized protein J4E78_009328 [Alternaria triticimaculans]KAI4645418.1 hypothetical protein J4E78_009328 [Alternaria triticimaculans]